MAKRGGSGRSRQKSVKKKPARKRAVARKPAKKKSVKKKPARKKVTKRPAAKKAPKQAATKRTAASSTIKAVKKPPKKLAKKPVVAKPVVPPGTQRVGRVVHYYSHLNVAVVSLDKGPLQVGDVIQIKGHTTDFRQTVQSMQIEHASITKAVRGDDFGLKVTDHAREHDIVYRVLNP